jgi:enoyl-CoA hydratase
MCHGKVNAMDLELCLALERCFEELDRNPEIEVAVLTGNRRVFSAGVDLKRLIAEPLDYVDEFFPAIRRMFFRVFTFSKPLVAAVSGHALAGGCVVASAADYRVLARDAKIGMPELRVGLALPTEGIECFRFAVAPHYFQRVVTSGASFSNEQALTAGLADVIAENGDVLPQALAFAAEYRQIPRKVFALTKEQIRRPVLEKIKEAERVFGSRIAELWKDETVREQVRRYVAERL